MRRQLVIPTVLLALALPATAAAHVTVVPKEAPAGAYTVFDVRVPNERDDAATVEVDLQLPDGFVAASYEPQPGWSVRVIRERLDRPIETDFGPIEEQVDRIVWSGDGTAAGSIPPGAFRDFPISVQVPDRPGATLTFKALQTYASGEIVRWIGDPDSDEPAPTVTVGARAGEGDGAGAGHGADEDAEPAVTGGATAAATDADDDRGASTGLAIAALVLGALGALLGGAALVRGRRRPTM
jgi:uncharacterized protein YcnI